MELHVQSIVRLAGLAQLFLAIGSLAIPGILNWRSELAKTHPLIKQMFWVYAAYIFVINICFALVSWFNAADICDRSRLATLVSGFIAVYWISRIVIQFAYFKRAYFPKGKWNNLGEAVLVFVFIFLSIVYSMICYSNYIK